MKKPDKDDLIREFGLRDTGFYYFGFFTQKGMTKIISFSNDRDGNGGREFIFLKYQDKCILVCKGSQLTEDEKNTAWYYKDYESLEELVGDISEFLFKFADSFELKLVRNI